MLLEGWRNAAQRNVKGSERELAAPHGQQPLLCLWWIKLLDGPARLSPGPGPVPPPSALAADPPPFRLPLLGVTHTPLPVCRHCPLAQEMRPSGVVGFQ